MQLLALSFAGPCDAQPVCKPKMIVIWHQAAKAVLDLPPASRPVNTGFVIDLSLAIHDVEVKEAYGPVFSSKQYHLHRVTAGETANVLSCLTLHVIETKMVRSLSAVWPI